MAILEKKETMEQYQENGNFFATITSVEIIEGVTIGNETKDMIEVGYQLDTGKYLKKRYKKILQKWSDFGDVVMAALGHIPDHLDTDELIGARCVVEVKNTVSRNGRNWSGVAAVHPEDDFDEPDGNEEGPEYAPEDDGDEYVADPFEQNGPPVKTPAPVVKPVKVPRAKPA